MNNLLNLTKIFLIFVIGMNNLQANNSFATHFSSKTVELSEMNSSFSDPIYVKLYLIILRESNGTGGWNEGELNEFISGLDDIFGSKEIYINLCITEIRNSYWFSNLNQNNANGFLTDIGMNHNDGIKGIISNMSAGWSHGIPSKVFGARYVTTAYHELGHCLGLYHTFEPVQPGQPNCGELAPYLDGQGQWAWGANASDAGDLVYDTPADLTENYSSVTGCENSGQVFFQNCQLQNPLDIRDAQNNPYTDVPDPDNPGLYLLGNNIMNYGPGVCKKLITNGQGERIKQVVRSQMSEVEQQNKYPIVYNMDFYINSDTDWWNKEKAINGNIYVNNGRLNIQNSSIYFTPGHGIRVMPSTELFVAYSTLGVDNLSACFNTTGTTWEGIVCDYTNPNLTGEPLVDIHQSRIENAEKGIRTIGTNGINQLNLLVWFSEFYNNRRSIELTNAEGFIQIALSQFYYNRTDEQSPSSQIRVDGSKALFYKVEVENLNTSISGWSFHGIESAFSDLSIVESEFKNFNSGIYRGVGFANNVYVRNSKFDNYYMGIHAQRRNSVLHLVGNKFWNSYYGIYMHNDFLTDNTLMQNIFQSSTNGIYYNGGAGKKSFYYGNVTYMPENFGQTGIDFTNTVSERSSLFLCNKMNHGGVQANHIFTRGPISPNQASKSIYGFASAGNTFVTVPQGNYNFAAVVPYLVRYFYHPGIPGENPEKHFGIHPRITMVTAGCAENVFDDGPDQYDPGDGNTVDEDFQYHEKVAERQRLLDTLYQNLDGGNTQQVLTLIDNANQLNAAQVAQYLTQLGPWLSEEAAVAFIDNANVFTAPQIVSVLAASPDVFINSMVYQFAFGTGSPLNPLYQEQLRVASATTTVRTVLQNKIEKIGVHIDHIIGNAIFKVVFTTDGSRDYSKQRMWTERKGTFQGRLEIAELYFREGNFTQAVNYLTAMMSNPGLKSDQLLDVQYFRSMTYMLANAYQDQRYEGALTTSEISLLESIANTGASLSQNKARGILEYFYGYEFDDLEPREDTDFEFKKPRQEADQAAADLIVFPNPNHGEFDIVVNAPGVLITEATVFTQDGRAILHEHYDGGIGKARITLVKAIKGIYLYNVKLDDGTEYTGKLIVE